ncbi:MAG: rod shape-determining protein MreD [Anaerolineae bacterium]
MGFSDRWAGAAGLAWLVDCCPLEYTGWHIGRFEINPYVALPLLTSAALIQTTLLSRVSVLGAQPNLLLLIVLLWSLVRGVDEGLMWGFLGGLIVDVTSGGPLAGTAIALLAAAYVAGQSLAEQVGSQVVRSMILTVLGTATYHLTLLIVLGWTGHTVDWAYSLTRVTVPSVVLNGVLAPLFLQPLNWLERATRREGAALWKST